VFDGFNRRIHYLRVSVTDECNLRCVYCRPEAGEDRSRRGRMLSFEEISGFVRVAAGMGVDKVRLTGGEPLLREGLPELVGMIAYIKDLAMTTNGVLLARFASDLRRAGLARVNVSLDAVDPESYARITRGGDLRDVLAGIDAALEANLRPVKLNCVVERSPSEPDARRVGEFAAKKGLEARFIRRMDPARGEFWPVALSGGGDCPRCNRLRLTSDGLLRPCLLSDLAFDVRELGAREAIRRAVEAKPRSGAACACKLYAIGG